MLENFSNPEENIKNLFIREGSVVADFGSGSGHYIFPLSKEVGDNGKVYAIDIQKDLLTKLESDTHQKGLKNIEMIWGDVEVVGGSKLRSDSLDALVLSNILFQVDSKSGLVHEAYRTLKSGGKALLVDWSESFGGLGPHTSSVVDEQTAKTLMENGGFILKEKISAGAHHYGMVFEKA